MNLPAHLQTLAIETARAAGQLLLQGASRKVNAETADDVKMQADIDSETLVREKLQASGLPIIGEELGGDASLFDSQELYWVVDPLDGTYNYLRRQPSTCVSLGLMHGSKPALGVIYNFNADKTYFGMPGQGLYLNGQKHTPAWVDRIGDACLMTGFPAAADKSPEAMQRFHQQVGQYKKIRMIGSAALALAYVSEGVADSYYEAGTNLWDVAAGLALIQAAGGFYRMVPSGKKPLNYDLWASGREAWTV